MKIKNYTSSVPVVRSVAMIEDRLVEAGARNITKSYDATGQIDVLIFDLPWTEGRMVPIRLPARIESVRQIMLANESRARQGRRETIKEQAPRTAWKLLFDWVCIQLSLITLGQAEALEVFLPYVAMSKTSTYYEMVKDSGFKQLPMSGG